MLYQDTLKSYFLSGLKYGDIEDITNPTVYNSVYQLNKIYSEENDVPLEDRSIILDFAERLLKHEYKDYLTDMIIDFSNLSDEDEMRLIEEYKKEYSIKVYLDIWKDLPNYEIFTTNGMVDIYFLIKNTFKNILRKFNF